MANTKQRGVIDEYKAVYVWTCHRCHEMVRSNRKYEDAYFCDACEDEVVEEQIAWEAGG